MLTAHNEKRKVTLCVDAIELRDYFAGFAMQGLIVADTQWTLNPKDLASMSYERADAMLKERQNIFPKE